MDKNREMPMSEADKGEGVVPLTRRECRLALAAMRDGLDPGPDIRRSLIAHARMILDQPKLNSRSWKRMADGILLMDKVRIQAIAALDPQEQTAPQVNVAVAITPDLISAARAKVAEPLQIAQQHPQGK